MHLSIIIPLYNEVNSIARVLAAIDDLQFPSFVNEVEIIAVDDASTDGSFAIIESLTAVYPCLRALQHKINGGKGAAVQTALAAAKGDTFIIQDADFELVPTDILPMLEAMHSLKVDFVNGSRYMDGIPRPLSSFKRYMANKVFTLLTAIMIDVKITDVACGYKLFTRRLAEQIILEEKRFGFEAELIIKALRIKRNNVAEVPVNYFPRNEGEGKKFRNKDALKMLWTIFKYGLFKR